MFFLNNIEKITKINNIIIPFLIIIILIIGTKNIFGLIHTRTQEIKFDQINLFWILNAILYSSYNLILLIPVLVSLNKLIKNNKQIIAVSAISRNNNFHHFNFNLFFA